MTNQRNTGSRVSCVATDLAHPSSKTVRKQRCRSPSCLNGLTEQFHDEALQLLARVTKYDRVLVWNCSVRGIFWDHGDGVLLRSCGAGQLILPVTLPQACMAIGAAGPIPAATLSAHIPAWRSALVWMAPSANGDECLALLGRLILRIRMLIAGPTPEAQVTT